MKQPSMGRVPIRALTVAAVLAALAIASCSTSSPTGPHPSTQPPTSAMSSTPGPTSPSPSGSPPVHPVKCAGGWRTGPVTVTHHVPVPPVPVATAIRTGSHPDCRFDRLVIDFTGPLPGYRVSFVPKVTQDGSGKTITIGGTSFLEIRLFPAQGHSDSGKPTLPVKVRSVGLPMLKSYVVSGDFEGYLSIALGLNGGTKYRTGELGGRVYIDVSW